MRYPVGESEAGKANLRHLGPGLCLSLSLSRTHTLARKYTDLHLIIRYFPVLLLSSSLSASSSFPPSFLLLLPHSNTIQVRAFLIFTDLQV